MDRKNLEALKRMELLAKFAGIRVHDHETAMYHFALFHAECNSHILRHLLKNTEDSSNSWSEHLANLLLEMHAEREKAIRNGETSFPKETLENYCRKYSEILALGREENLSTSPRWARKEEAALLSRLERYNENHLLFLRNFKVAFTNNMSKGDLRKCKNRQKVARWFRNLEGYVMFADILSLIETAKRKSESLQCNPRHLQIIVHRLYFLSGLNCYLDNDLKIRFVCIHLCSMLSYLIVIM